MQKLAAIICLILSGCAALTPRVSTPTVAGSHYVAMGSSFAAGPGIMPSADTPPTRCSRSANNYAHQLAARLKLELSDVSCGGATTAHVLGAWNELPAQIDALRSDTRLVTVTIGGNDVGYISSLFIASCAGNRDLKICKSLAALRKTGQTTPPEPDEAAWQQLEIQMSAIAEQVRLRSPNAKLIFVDYLTVLPSHSSCTLAPVDPDLGDKSRIKAERLANLTARVARKMGADIVRASKLSAGHDACAEKPWMNGFDLTASPYHPNLAGMTAVTDALELKLKAK